ncbi:MAG: ExeM/NucH family extracellular endonuclease, partial [Anaerolineae bacterium]
MTASFRSSRKLLAFVLVFVVLASLGALPAFAQQGPPIQRAASAPLANNLRISQVYGGGGNSGATYTHDFIELFNAGATTINLSGYSVQYTSATGSTWQVTNLSGSIASGQYFLIQEAQGSGGTTPLPTPDVIGTIAMSGSNGKVALVNTSTAQTGTCPTGSQIIDFVGFGSANCFEGSGATPALTNTTAALRAGDGCTDTDSNVADFTTGAPTPRNTASALHQCTTGDVPPTVSSTTPADGAGNVSANTTVDVTFSEPVTLTGTVAISCSISGVQNVTPTGGPTTFTLPHTNFAPGDHCTVTITAGQVSDQDGTPDNMAANYSWSFDIASGCFTPSTQIHDIQGAGAASSMIGQQHTIEAQVVADFQSVATIRGFFVQEPDAEVDADPATSEGLFVYDNNFGVDVAVGDYVRVTGFVSEFQNQTQLSSVNAVINCDDPTTVSPVPVLLPFPDTSYPERYEGMSVYMTQTLTVNENFNLGRGGILTLSNGRLQQPTNVVAPGAPAIALQAANNLNQITLDDGSLLQNPDPIIFPPPALAALNTVRSGDEVVEVVGVFTQGNPGWTTPGNIYRIQATGTPVFTVANPRPAAPNPVRAGGTLKVSSFNVLNYFLTLDTTSGTGPCGPAQNVECRGANTAAELTRQRDKLLQALNRLNADIVGLMELENTPGVDPLADIVTGLNALAGAGTYDYIDTGVIDPGDVIKVGLIYKPAAVQPVGDFAILNSLVDPNFDTSRHRPTLAQSFQQVATNGRFTIVVNHLKSKGCTGAAGLDTDQGDGQSCFNATRTTGANALVDWIATDPTGTGDSDFLVVGDLNSYAMEDPIVAIESGGYTNLETQFVGANAYSYVFSAQAGSLDHSLANASLLPQVTGATTWHINADEPSVLDYNVEFKSAGQVTSLYNADPYRTSDHDPLLIGLNLAPVDTSILLTKTVGTSPGVCATTSMITVPAGTAVYYCYTVANTGNLTLYMHDLVDDQLGSIFASLPYTLTPGSSVSTVDAGLEISATLDATTANTALWTAYNVGPIDVITATASATVYVPLEPGIVLTKTVGTTPGVCATTSKVTVPTGTTVYYCYQVEN